MPDVPTAVLVPLLHAAAMQLFPAMMGLSTTMCLARSPSPYSVVAVRESVSRTRAIELLWIAGGVAWTLFALEPGSPLWAGSGAAMALGVATAVVVLAVIGAQLWLHTTVASELAALAARVAEGGRVTTEGDNGTIIALRREPEGGPQVASAARGVRLFAIVATGAVALFAAAAGALGAAQSGARLIQCLVLAGFYSSLGVFFIDLIQDVWPGFTTKQRLERASRYYVQIFEQWVNYGVLAAFLTVLVGAPVAWLRGYAPVAVIAFPVWIACCLCFAAFFNQVLNRNGIVESRLPLPVCVNEYSATRPLWAHFFTVIHVVMAAGLVAGLIAVSTRIR